MEAKVAQRIGNQTRYQPKSNMEQSHLCEIKIPAVDDA
jgi:hypothetical protein